MFAEHPSADNTATRDDLLREEMAMVQQENNASASQQLIQAIQAAETG